MSVCQWNAVVLVARHCVFIYFGPCVYVYGIEAEHVRTCFGSNRGTPVAVRLCFFLVHKLRPMAVGTTECIRFVRPENDNKEQSQMHFS